MNKTFISVVILFVVGFIFGFIVGNQTPTQDSTDVQIKIENAYKRGFIHGLSVKR